jgi:Glycosyltransferases involved in cell wall biogenesis
MISIIIPVYNVEGYIENSMKSIFDQTFTDYELILVDDGSSDKSIEIVKKLIESHRFKKYEIITEKNSGQGVARNTGMLKARGEWIYFMDADDLLPRNALAVMQEVAEKSLADMVFCGFEFSKNGLINKEVNEYKTNLYTSKEIQLAYLLRKKKILVPGTLYRSKWLQKKEVVFPQLRFSEDVYFLWKAITKAQRVAEIDGCLYTYIVRKNSTMTSSKFSNIKKSYEEFYELSLEFQKDNRVIKEVKRWMLSRWVLGIMRANAGIMKWNEYNIFMQKLSYKEHCRNLKGFPDQRVNLMRNISLFNLRVFYLTASKRNPYL